MVRHFQKEYFEGSEPYPDQKERSETVFADLTRGFEFLSQKSFLLQRINKILILTGIVGIGIGWFLYSWAGVGLAVVALIVINLAFGAWHSRDIRNYTGWDDEALRAANALITEPLWQMDISR